MADFTINDAVLVGTVLRIDGTNGPDTITITQNFVASEPAATSGVIDGAGGIDVLEIGAVDLTTTSVSNIERTLLTSTSQTTLDLSTLGGLGRLSLAGTADAVNSTQLQLAASDGESASLAVDLDTNERLLVSTTGLAAGESLSLDFATGTFAEGISVRFFGGIGDESVTGDIGDDRFFGGNGEDIFAATLDNGDDVFADFADGIDRIDLRGLAAADAFDAVQNATSDGAGGTLLTFASGGSIRLQSLSLDDFDANDVIVDDSLLARSDRYDVPEDGSIAPDAAIGVLANDVALSAGTLTVSLVTDVTDGSLTLNPDGSFSYAPDPNFDGTDSFTYEVSDGTNTDQALVELVVTPENDPPVLVDPGPLSVAEGTLAVAALTSEDPDTGDTRTFSISGGADAALFTISATTGALAFAATPDFEAPADQGANNVYDVTVRVTDGQGVFDEQAIAITVTNLDEGPVATVSIAATPASAPEGDTGTRTVTWTLSRTGDTTAAVTATLALSGTADAADVVALPPSSATIPAGQASTTVTAEVVGDVVVEPDETLTLAIQTLDRQDHAIGTAVATSTIENDDAAPIAADDAFETDEDTALAPVDLFADNGDGADSADAAFSIVRAFTSEGTPIALDGTATALPEGGEVTLVPDGTLVFDPLGDYQALGFNPQPEPPATTATFSYVIGDGLGEDTASVTIGVRGLNDAPNAVDDAGAGFATEADVPFTTASVLTNDTDVDQGTTLTIASIDTTGTQGLVTDNGDGTFDYDPNGAFDGLAPGESATDAFSYSVEDGDGGSDTATVTIGIGGVVREPDLTLRDLVVPATGIGSEDVTVSYTLVNEGDGAAEGGFVERVFVSRDAVLDASDRLVREIGVTADLPAGGEVARSLTGTLPDADGPRFLIVSIDDEDAIAESDEADNTEAAPIALSSAFTAEIETAPTNAAFGEAFMVSGRATQRADGDPAIGVFVTVEANFGGVTRSFSALTDGFGRFSLDIVPLVGAGESVALSARSPVNPDEDAAPEATVGLFGFDFDDARVNARLIEGQTVAIDLPLTNLASTGLTSITAVLDGLDPALTGTVTSAPMTLAGAASDTATVTIEAAADAADELDTDLFTVTLTSAEGATADVEVVLEIVDTIPDLVAVPPMLEESMLLGEITTVTFEVFNQGGAPTGPLDVVVPEAAFLDLISPMTLPSLGVGESATIDLALTPDADLPLGLFEGAVQVIAAEDAVTVPFEFLATTDQTGDLTIEVVDEFFFFDAGMPRLDDAVVVVRDAFTGEIVAENRDVDGLVAFEDLPLGFYTVEVDAEAHAERRLTVEVRPGGTSVQAFLPSQVVEYEFTVREIEIEDVYEVVVDATFRTNVPVPVVDVQPQVLDLQGLDAPGDSKVIELTLDNRGLIAANDLELNLGEHPLYEIVPLIDELPLLDAGSSVTIPVTITRTAPDDGEPIPCVIPANVVYDYDAGPNDVTSVVPIGYVNIDADCVPEGVSTPPIFGGSGGGGSSGGIGGGSGGGGILPVVPRIPVVSVDQGVEVEVGIEIGQEVVLTRQGFEGVLNIRNLDTEALSDIEVLIEIRDVFGNVVGESVFVITDTDLDGLTAVDGTGVLGAMQTGSAAFTIVPSREAAPGETTDYLIGGRLRYTEGDGTMRDIALSGTGVSVEPQPEIELDYFLARDVFADDPFSPYDGAPPPAPFVSPYPDGDEPAIPFDLAVLARNVGAGTARDLSITSAQPEIVDNEQGLLIGFDILGASVNGAPAQPSLTADFGDVASGDSATAVFSLVTDLQGRFVDYAATVQNIGPLSGFPELSLITDVEIRELIRTVMDDRLGADDLPDFLVNDVADPLFVPDTLYTSEGTVEAVDEGAVTVVDGDVSDGMIVVEVTGGAGWTYAAFEGPNLLDLEVVSVTRADGTALDPANVWQTDRRYPESGRPVYEDRIKLIDFGTGTETYTVTLEDPSPQNAPVAMDDPLTTDENTALAANVLANDTDAEDDPLTVVEVNGFAALVGEALTLDGGAMVTIDADGDLTLDPSGDYEALGVGESAEETLTYTVSDGALSDTATVTITIDGANDDPVAVDDNGDGFTVGEDTSVTTASVLANDTDIDGDTLSVIDLDTTGTQGLVIDNGDGTFDYDPNGAFDDLDEGETAGDSFVYTVGDGQGGTDTATVTIIIEGADDDTGGGGEITDDDGDGRVVGSPVDETVVAPAAPVGIVAGGGGGDTFRFTDRPGQRDVLRIEDFAVDPEAEADTLDLAGASIGRVATFGPNTFLLLDGPDRDTILLVGINAEEAGRLDIVNEGGLLI